MIIRSLGTRHENSLTRRELPTRQGGPARAAFEVEEWHYRSRREPLIAFSNHHFDDDDLVTFPSPDDLDGSTAVRFVHAPDGRWRSTAGFNPLEAKRFIRLMRAECDVERVV